MCDLLWLWWQLCQKSLFEKEPDSILDRMVKGHRFSQIDRAKDGTYLIDRSPDYFKAILNYFRTGKVFIDPDICVDGVLEEARFYEVSSMVHIISNFPTECFEKFKSI